MADSEWELGPVLASHTLTVVGTINVKGVSYVSDSFLADGSFQPHVQFENGEPTSIRNASGEFVAKITRKPD